MMSNSKHTPGVWSCDLREDYVDGTPLEVLDKDNFPIAEVQARPILNRWDERTNYGHWARGVESGETQRKRTQEELVANTRLIAAAPAMFEALNNLAFAEDQYRRMHDFEGDGSIQAGRAWDVMRRHGDAAREILEGITGTKI